MFSEVTRLQMMPMAPGHSTPHTSPGEAKDSCWGQQDEPLSWQLDVAASTDEPGDNPAGSHTLALAVRQVVETPMSGAPRIAFSGGQITGDTSGYKPAFVGPWMLKYGASYLDTTLELRALEALLGAKITWRTADVLTSMPNAWETPLTARTANGVYTETVDLSGETDNLWVQPMVLTALTSGTTPKGATSRLWASLQDAGWVVARQRLVLPPSSSDMVLPIGKPFPCAGATGLMFGLVIRGVSGTIVAPTTMWRSFDSGDPDTPNAWAALTAGSDVTADGLVNVVDAITTTNKLMAQAGLKYSTSGTNPYATVDVIVAAKQ